MTLLPRNNSIKNTEPALDAHGNRLFPVFLKLESLHTVVIGGGNVGLEKLTALLTNSPAAAVTVISKTFLPELHALTAGYPQLNIVQKAFIDTDLDGADVVIAATNDPELNRFIRQSAHDRKLLINVADKPELCDFYLGAIVKKGDLKIGISTNGKSPTVAKRLKEVLNEALPDELDTTLQQMNAIRNSLSGDFAYKVQELNRVTAPLVAKQAVSAPESSAKKYLTLAIWGSFVAFILIALTSIWFREPGFQIFVKGVNPAFYYFLGAGFVFAMIDGAIGMSYGVTSTTFSLALGIPPASASMGVHLSEIMSNGIAGWMHYRMGNVNWKLFKLLLLPGIVGAVTGAYIVSSLEHYSMYTKPAVSVYTLILGFVILSKALTLNRKRTTAKIKNIRLLGLGGGFIDAVGGGGWGSIVLSTLIAGGRHPRFSLGTVKLSRFFIALISSLTFIIMLNGKHWEAVAGLVIGSALASPIAARISNKISAKAIMFSVAVIVILISLRSIGIFLMKVI